MAINGLLLHFTYSLHKMIVSKIDIKYNVEKYITNEESLHMLKRFITAICVLSLLMSFTVNTIHAQNTIGVRVNGIAVNFKNEKVIMDSNYRTLVPVREFCEALGAQVRWDGATKQIKIIKEDITILLGINQRKLYVNGNERILDTEAILLGSKTYVPLRSITEALNQKIEWKASTKTVDITVDPSYNHYRGQLHSHTNYSDGLGDILEAYSWARNQSGVDFIAVTDHSQMFDNDMTATLDYHESEEWAFTKAIADQCNVDGEFVAIVGFEQSYYDKTSGHINTYNTEGFLSSNTVNLQEYYKAIEQNKDSISQFNHPGTTWGDFDNFGYYSEDRDDVIHLIEVGNGPGTQINQGYWRCDSYYSKALDKGWHVAPTNGQDNHQRFWGDSNPFRTVILAKELTREALFDAIREHRVYAAEDINVEVNYSLNGYIMGSEIDDQVGSVDINVTVTDPDVNDNVQEITVISNGGKAVAYKTIKSSSNTVNYQVSLEPPSKSAYYFIKIKQKDGNLIFTAPIWIEKQ